jgi:hypothetical protein
LDDDSADNNSVATSSTLFATFRGNASATDDHIQVKKYDEIARQQWVLPAGR